MRKHYEIAPQKTDVDMYGLSEDGGLIYDPLSREGAKTGTLYNYASAEKVTGVLKTDGVTLTYAMPKEVTAYELLPIEYELTAGEETRYPIHFEANAFEEGEKTGGKTLYDMTLPGKLDLRWEYLGYVTGHYKDPESRNRITPDNSDSPAASYPNYTLTEFVRSGTIEAGDIVWFRFRFTNTGNTILDPEGAGAMIICPLLTKDGPDGWTREPYNLYYRLYDYIYPGESKEIWLNFGRCLRENSFPFDLGPGEYTIHLQAVYRNDQDGGDFMQTIWGGRQMSVSTFSFKVAEKGVVTPPQPVISTMHLEKPTRNTYLAKYEEFMTSFDAILSPERKSARGIVYLQVAPWTTEVALKLMTEAEDSLAGVNIPVEVETDSIKVELNPNTKSFTVVNGKKEPLFMSQIMADMRANVQVGPHPEERVVQDLLDMRKHGVNCLATTAMPWIFENFPGNQTPGACDRFNPFGDAYKYALDIVREMGLRVESLMTYPINRYNYGFVAGWIKGETIDFRNTGDWRIDTTDPILADINATMADYYFERWGDIYYQYPHGRTPVCTEDTRGWMRCDLDIRYMDGPVAMKEFAKWAVAKYGSLEEVNKAWGTAFTSEEEINPERYGQHNRYGHRLEYLDQDQPFHDWNQAMTDYDVFRTEIRVKNYQEILSKIKGVPAPGIAIRTEGGNWLASGIPAETRNQRYRHVTMSQRRCGMIAEIVQESGTVLSHSDYTSMPYSPSEVRELTRLATEQGINSMMLPYFDKMRDIAVNEKYGKSYQVAYNLKSDGKGAVIHTLTAAFPWFKAIYEEGGAAGVLWEDIECDGIVGETQKKEMLFYQKKLREALDTPEGRAWQEDLSGLPDEGWRAASKKKQSVDPAFVKEQLLKQEGVEYKK